MNDEELMTAVRESFTDVHSSTPVEQIVSRSRAVRARRRIPGAAGALAVVAAAALAVTALVPGGSHQGSSQPGVQLAAWTVAKLANGSISVTIRELRDPAGLQATLRADGVPASVRFSPSRRGQPNPCRGYDGSQALYHKVLQGIRPAHPGNHSTIVIIHPSALPRGAGVGLQVGNGAGYAHGPGQHQLGIVLVQASPACTGS
jgi:hypothetical protein